MLPPMSTSSPNAIQLDTAEITFSNAAPRRYPIIGMSAWNPPNHAPHISMWRGFTPPIASPLQTDTANASIDNPTARSSNSISPIIYRPLFSRTQKSRRICTCLTAYQMRERTYFCRKHPALYVSLAIQDMPDVSVSMLTYRCITSAGYSLDVILC